MKIVDQKFKKGITGDFVIQRCFETIKCTKREYILIKKNGLVRKVFKVNRGLCGKLIYVLKDMRKTKS